MEGLFRNKARGIDTQVKKVCYVQIARYSDSVDIQVQDSETRITCLARQGQDH